MPRLRFQNPDRLPGATDFSSDDSLRGSLNAVKLVKSQDWVWDKLRKACELEIKYARKRDPGHWELAAVAFVASRQVDIQPWWDESTDDLWRECGFKAKPSYPTVHRRLRELGGICDEFLNAAGAVIRRCREHDSRVMAHVHFDWTEDEAHLSLIHDCQPGDVCKRKGNQHGSRGAARAARAKTIEAREHREQWNTEDPSDSELHDKESLPEQEIASGQKSRRVRVGGCWYRIRDAEAGVRAYTRNGRVKRFWIGFYSGKGIDHFTGGVVPSVNSASRQECHLFPELYDRVCDMAGAAPETAIGDKGLSISSCFEHATTCGTAPIFPWRQYGDGKRHDKLTHDRHGVMRCKHCGGPMAQIKFSRNNGKPRLWFRCTLQATQDCAKDQTISCSTDWRSLVPLARTEALYHELRESHQTYEGVHHYWRTRYKVAGDDLGVRIKALGLDWHRLRANVACLIDWLRIASRNGWLETATTPRKAGERRFKKRAENIAKRFAQMRVRMGVAAAYGPQAAKLGIGSATPPSERAPKPAKAPVALNLPGP